MLDPQVIDQLKSVFQKLENKIEIVLRPSLHPDHAELKAFLQDVADTSDKIDVISPPDVESSSSPQFFLRSQGRPNGVIFTGIPTGHEFTSLIVALLNSDGKGKMPDAALIRRIRSLKGPIKIRTFISLTCENCPDVVQAMNQMAILHGNFQHEMIDGAYAQEEIEALAIQGVPSVVVDSKLIHSGRISFLDLVAKLESVFGIDTSAVSGELAPTDLGLFDVVVIGGGPAGASAAIYSARKGLSTAVITERLGGQVQDTKGIENLISIPYTEGPKLAAQLGQHMDIYPIKRLEQRRVASVTSGKPHRIELEGGETISANSLIVTTGAKWRELGVPGEKEYIGRGVAFCPHCDGPYYKGKKIAVIGGGNSGVEAAIDLAGIVREVVLFEFNDSLKADKILVDKLLSLGNTRVVTSARTSQIVGDGQKVNALEYEDRKSGELKKEVLDGVFVQIGLLPNSGFLKGQVQLNKFGEIIVDEKGRTSSQGIYAAGDVTTTPFKQIIIAMGEGAKAALAAFEDRMYAH